VKRARLAAFVLLVAAACPGGVRPMETPLVELRSASLLDGALAAELLVVNPNHEGLVVEAVDWQLDVDEQPLARGRQDLRVVVAALAPAPVSLRGTLSPGQAAHLGGGAATLSGTLHLRSSRGLVAASFYGAVEPAATRASSAGQ